MYLKLAIQNVKRSIRDYAIYITTIVMAVSILFAFLSLALSNDIQMLAENITSLSNSIIGLSVALMIVFFFLVDYAMGFIIKRRKKEIGIYMLLGIDQMAVFKMFLLENLVIGCVAFFLGIICGFALYQIFVYLIFYIFETPYYISFQLSLPAVMLSGCLFFILYGLVSVKNSRYISRIKIKDLVYGEKYNEVVSSIGRKKWFLVFCSNIMICVLAVILLYNSIKTTNNSSFIYMFLAVIFTIAGIYGIYSSVTVGISQFKDWLKPWCYKGTNIILFGRLNSQINTTSKVISVSAVLLTLALILLITGLSMGTAYKTNIKYEAPFDVSVSIDSVVLSFDEVKNFIKGKVDVRDSFEYYIYYSDTPELSEVPILRLSDYNIIRQIIGLDVKEITENQFIVHSDTWNVRKVIEQKMKDKPTIDVGSFSMEGSIEYLFSEPFEQYRTNGFDGYILVLPDVVCEFLQPEMSRLLVATTGEVDQSLRGELSSYIKKEWIPEFKDSGVSNTQITMYVGVKAWSIANGLTALSILSFGSIYLSLILFLIIGTILSLQQMIGDAANTNSFSLLIKIGVKTSELYKLLLKQVAIYFFIPIIFPIVMTIFYSCFLNLYFGTEILIEGVIPFYTAISITVFLFIYLCYFIVTYFLLKRSISKQL